VGEGVRWAKDRAMSLVLCFILVVGLSGCRSLGSVRPTVKIGLVAPFEGRYRYIGYDVIYAVRLALREVNAAGGVGGYSVELVAFDDGADPTMAVEQARKLAADPEVVAAIGHFREDTTLAALRAYAESGIPIVVPAVFDPALTSGREASVYRLAPSVDTVTDAWLGLGTRLGYDRAALVTDGGPLGAALQQNAAGSGALRIGPVVSPESVGWLEEVVDSGVEVVFCDANPVAAGEVDLALRAAGWKGVFVGGPELAAPDFVAVAGEAAEGAVFVTAWPFPADVPGGEDFAMAYRGVSNGVSPGSLAPLAYEAAQVLLEALGQDIAAHREPTREGMARALPAIGYEGVLGHIVFDASHCWSDAPLHWYRIDAGGIARPTDGD
jgi:ABC-type branched-subunit amino acid transport system substrate-binding protein